MSSLSASVSASPDGSSRGVTQTLMFEGFYAPGHHDLSQKNDSSSIRPFTQEDQVAQIEAKSYIQGTLAVSSGGIVYKHYISPAFLFLVKDL